MNATPCNRLPPSELHGSPNISSHMESCCNALQSLNFEHEEERPHSTEMSELASSLLVTEMEAEKAEQVPMGGGYLALDETWLCAICRDKIKVEETAQIKGCEHAYCVTCILRWASYKTEPWCPQCRLPFSFLFVYRALDGSLNDYMLEESVCLLLRAPWFKPLRLQEFDEQDDYQEEDDVYEEYYYTSPVRLGNRRWGDSGYVRTGRREARPVGVRQLPAAYGVEAGASSSRQSKGKELSKTGRRAKRAQKREAADKMLEAKGRHEQTQCIGENMRADLAR